MAAHYQCVRNTRKKARTATNLSHEQGSSHVDESNQGFTSAPPIIPHITVGVNEVTKALETEVRSSRPTVVIPSPAVDQTHALTSAIFICYADLDTPAIVAHLPQLVALCNSMRSENHKIKVVQLPVGAQGSLANALGYLKRISVLALDVCSFRLCYRDY
jgi:ribonuclease P/MRP protein subunit POP3